MSETTLKAIGERTHISLRIAAIIVVVAIIPPTVFAVKLAAGQDSMKESQRVNQQILEEKIDTNCVSVNKRIDSLSEVMDLRRKTLEVKAEDMDQKFKDHEARIRVIEIENRKR